MIASTLCRSILPVDMCMSQLCMRSHCTGTGSLRVLSMLTSDNQKPLVLTLLMLFFVLFIGRLWGNVVATASVRWCLRLLPWAAWASVAPGLLPVGGRPVGGLRLRARAVPVGLVAARPRCRAGWACVPLPFVPPRSAAGDEADIRQKKKRTNARRSS